MEGVVPVLEVGRRAVVEAGVVVDSWLPVPPGPCRETAHSKTAVPR